MKEETQAQLSIMEVKKRNDGNHNNQYNFI